MKLLFLLAILILNNCVSLKPKVERFLDAQYEYNRVYEETHINLCKCQKTTDIIIGQK